MRVYAGRQHTEKHDIFSVIKMKSCLRVLNDRHQKYNVAGDKIDILNNFLKSHGCIFDCITCCNPVLLLSRFCESYQRHYVFYLEESSTQRSIIVKLHYPYAIFNPFLSSILYHNYKFLFLNDQDQSTG